MKIYEWNIGMAATIPSNNGYTLLPWIIDEIVNDKPDCIVLTEFVVSKGMDYFIDVLERNKYHWFVSSTTKDNGILIALCSDSFRFDETFNYEKCTIKTSTDVLIGEELPNLYEIQVTWNGSPLSIIGARICVPLSSENTNYKYKQFKALDDYLSSQEHDVICIGDFNAYWSDIWDDPVKNRTMIRTMQNGYSIHTPLYGIGDWYSYIQPNGDKNQLDHLITNINDKTINVNYYWDFINSSRYHSSQITKESSNKPKGLPDHAILKATII